MKSWAISVQGITRTSSRRERLSPAPSAACPVCLGQRHRHTASIRGTAKPAPFAMEAAASMDSGAVSATVLAASHSDFAAKGRIHALKKNLVEWGIPAPLNFFEDYSTLIDLYRRGQFQEDCLSIMTQAFYEPFT